MSQVARVPFIDLSRKITRHRKLIDGAIKRVLDSGHFVLGNECAKFERQFADYIGVAHCVGVASGSDAIEIALRGCEISAKMKVATSANAGHYATTAIEAIGAQPIFMDVDFTSRNISLSGVQSAISQGADAVIATHLYGLAIAEISEIEALCKESNVILIEDCAQAHGAKVNEKMVGSFGHASAFSFYPTKNLGALGEAGAVLTNSADIATKVRQLRTYGWSEKYSIEIPGGRNSRLDEIQAAVLNDLLPYLDSDNARRREIANAYCQGIEAESIDLPVFIGSEFVAHLFVISVDNREKLIANLEKSGISTAIHFPIPDHLQPYKTKVPEVTLPVSEKLAGQVLSLPCYPELIDGEVERIISVINGSA